MSMLRLIYIELDFEVLIFFKGLNRKLYFEVYFEMENKVDVLNGYMVSIDSGSIFMHF